MALASATVASDIFTIGRTLMVLCAEVPEYQGDYEFTVPPAEHCRPSLSTTPVPAAAQVLCP